MSADQSAGQPRRRRGLITLLYVLAAGSLALVKGIASHNFALASVGGLMVLLAGVGLWWQRRRTR